MPALIYYIQFPGKSPAPSRATELFQHLSDPLQLLLNGRQKFMSVSIRSLLDRFQFHLLIFKSLEVSDLLFRSGDGEPVLVQEFLDLQDQVQVFPPVETLGGPALVGPDD